jgi:hypothetical protein
VLLANQLSTTTTSITAAIMSSSSTKGTKGENGATGSGFSFLAAARNVGVLGVGLVVGSLVNMSLILYNAKILYPMPMGTSLHDPNQLAAYVATLPPPAFLVVFAAHYGQAVVGGCVAATLATRGTRTRMCRNVVALTALGSLMNSWSLRDVIPAWTWIEIPLYLVVGWAMERYLLQTSTLSDGRSAKKNP